MMDTVPNYYHKFNCIADKCKHNCCIGWEILIDDETMSLYEALDTPFGEKIRANIAGEPPHFVLAKGDRCPFLAENGLCDIICEYGEDAICDICYLHPRFKNFYENFEETGLGLACEEAARIILTEKEKFLISVPDFIEVTPEEKQFFTRRQEIFDILQDRSKTIRERFTYLAESFGFEFEFSLEKLVDLYRSLIRLDEEWTKELNKLKDFNFSGKIFEDDDDFQIIFEQLSVYFVFRNLTGALEDGNYTKRVKYTLISCYLLGAMFEFYGENLTEEKMIDLARMYSAEIEYAEENTKDIFDAEF